MSAVSLARPPRIKASVSARPALRLLHLAYAAYAAIAGEIRLRSEMQRLAEYDDHMLRDIGITRMDIDRVVRDGRPR